MMDMNARTRAHGVLLFLATGAALSLASVGCGGGDLDCQTSQDCFMGQYCVQGTCQDDPPVVTVNNTNAGNNQVSNNQMTANNQVTNNQTTGTNQTAGGNQSTNNSSVMIPAGSCRVDPFNAPECVISDEEREDEPNESSGFDATGFMGNSRAGCYQGYDTEYRGVQHTNSRVLCGFENSDWYKQVIETCNNRDFVATFTLTPTTACLPEDVRFRIEDVFDSQTAQTDCADPLLDCQQTEGGGWVIKMLFPKKLDEDEKVVENYRQKTTYFFAVSSPYDAQFSYDLSVDTPPTEMESP